MALKLFNTRSRSVQEFAPLDPAGRKVGLYCCGPTVYDFAHIGNWRTFVFCDLVRRYLEFKGYAVQHVMNITDVEDKIIKRVRETNTTLRDFTGQFEAAFFEDLKTLNCRMPHQTPHATEHIADIIALIEKLITRGLAYKAPDGSVYFSIEKYRSAGCQYGQLLKLNFEEMRVGERVRSDEYAKEAVADFALWKTRTPEDGTVFWPSPWGEGRPGWHIECSAMSMKLLGASFDLHLGGEDLVFPHHEDEIAQSEGARLQRPGQPFVKYWMHGAHLMVEGKKMAKSLGNYFTTRDLLAKGFSGREIRYLLLTAHYRETFNFTLDGLQSARLSLARIDECLSKLREVAGTAKAKEDASVVQRFSDCMDDDLNVSGAWGAVFDWVRDSNRRLAETSMDAPAAAAALATWDGIDSVLGIGAAPDLEVPAEITALLEGRQAARKAKDFKRADAIREELKTKGWLIEDTPKGARVKKL
ncbi:MAG TPA: cysteine--tRNA ligase [Candidatus Binatia bacterium]|jgi:cysteinyl-tRNA synthetase|nr:cysteine--tRNA ligase [Candidatus Binatia bacterium]